MSARRAGKSMARIAPLESANAVDGEIAAILAFAEQARAPDPRMARVLVRTPAGVAFMKYWVGLLYEGVLPHRLKEIVRIYLSAAEGCAYCTSVRSARGRQDGVSDELLLALDDCDRNPHLSERERAALRFARRFKADTADDDAVFEDLRAHFSDEEILELGLFSGTVAGIGGFAKLLKVVSWDEVCELRPELSQLRKLSDPG
jgi:AhpD family alkylhydroperoxidase